MLELHTRVCPNEAEIAAEVLDGEAILINLATGAYYSMDKAGALLWRAIEQHCSLEEIAGRLTDSYAVSLEDARSDVARIAGQLLEEKLVTISAAAESRGEAFVSPAQRSPYESPALSAYTDLRNLLALDPPMPWVDRLDARDHGRGPSTT